jgi:hypothetical protein
VRSIAWTILLGVAFGVVLGEARSFVRELGLRRDIEIVARWSALGARQAPFFRSELFPRLGYGDSLLVAALLARWALLVLPGYTRCRPGAWGAKWESGWAVSRPARHRSDYRRVDPRLDVSLRRRAGRLIPCVRHRADCRAGG